ncbi:aminopeptidase N-like isoform X2 [Daphnia pulex]|nr:aminopeptidase N-like isoform X2 [Daphnia pulex]
MSIVLKQVLLKGHKYRIGLYYLGKVREDSRGFYRANYKNDVTSCCHQGWFGGTQMQATDARRVLPCLDEPGLKMTFDVVVGHSNAMTALSNMPEISSRAMTTTRDWMWTSFSRSPPMPTYLLAMFVTDYESLETIYQLDGDRSVKLRFWGRPDQLPHLKESMAVAGDLLNYLVKYVRQPFTLPKIDFITAPIQLHFEAMENWGLILFRENRLYHNKETDSEDDRFTLIQIMAHELAHQFFGNLVTSNWWSDIWFNEGMSSLFEMELTDYAMPNDTYRCEAERHKSIRSAMKFEEERTEPLTVIRQVETAEEAEKMFDPLSYSKGSGLFLMLRNFVGHEKFRNALITYMDRYQFQSVNSRNFMEILNEQLHQDREFGRTMNVTKIMNSWTHQPSYPIVRCSLAGNGRIRLSQMPFPLLRSNSSQVNALWWIPIAMTDGRRPDFTREGTYPRVWLTPERPTLEIPYFPQVLNRDGPAEDQEPDTWILVNGQFAIYGRVLYDKANWRLISNQLMLNHTVIPKVTRAQLIDDAFTLAGAGYLDYQVVVELIEYLTLVNDEFVQSTSLFHLKLIQERSRHNESLYNLFKEYTSRFKFEKTDHGEPGDYNDWVRVGDPLDGVGCLNWSDDGVCVDQVMRLFHAQMGGSITPEEKKAMTEHLERNWCAVIRYGGKEEWNWAWRASLCDMWSSQRTKILSAMSCSQDRDRLKQLLSRVFSPTIEQDPHDTFATIEKMTENHVARSMVLNFLATNWEILGRHYRRSGDNLKLLTSAAKFLSTPDELKEMSRILSDLENKDKKLNRAFTNGILEGIRNNIRWGEKNLEQVYLVIESRIMTRRSTNSLAKTNCIP